MNEKSHYFDHERLEEYQAGMKFVVLTNDLLLRVVSSSLKWYKLAQIDRKTQTFTTILKLVCKDQTKCFNPTSTPTAFSSFMATGAGSGTFSSVEKEVFTALYEKLPKKLSLISFI
jgi:hypothetical protein